tara:strand:- start:65 stop:508 length:444 start_codon:yes stop_codon:yes gene_type:complete
MTIYPNAINFSNKHSVANQGLLDLTLSYSHEVVAQTLGNVTLGNNVLVFSRDHGEGIHVYSAVITNKLTRPSKIWYNFGGKLWKNNWEIIPTSKIKYLTEAEVKGICGLQMSWQICNPSFMGSGKNTEKIGNPRVRLLDYLQTNHPS